jgi:hypothetical protein
MGGRGACLKDTHTDKNKHKRLKKKTKTTTVGCPAKQGKNKKRGRNECRQVGVHTNRPDYLV